MTDTTALDAIKTIYPAQYYGQYDTTQSGLTTLTTIMDVWNGLDVSGRGISILGLPAAATMVALSAQQFTLADQASGIWVQGGALLYPARYYASYDTTATQPTAVTGWYDTWNMSSLAGVAAASAMVAVAATDWDNTAFRLPAGKGVQNAAIIEYTPPPAPVPLATQAVSALASARAYVSNTYTMLNEATPDAWVTYLKALMAIAGGTDTTSTTLPTAPAD
ncbi:hypothetical protein [Acetobacter sp.]|uniref:hypothetical protein n=2 Tax=Acetobacter sp. TaxID=440 RepID=UPI0039E87FDA